MNPDGRPSEFVPAKTSASFWLAGVLCLGLVLRAWATFREGAVWVNTDTLSYLAMADAILRGDPVSAFPNGYPLLLAGLKWLVGEQWLLTAAVAVNVALSTLIVFYSGAIARIVSTQRGAVLAAGLVAIWPNQINYTRQLLSETLATFLLVLGFFLLLRQRGVAAGAAVYAAAFVRSSLLPVLPLVVCWMRLVHHGWRPVGLFALGAGLCATADLALKLEGVIGTPNNVGMNVLIASRIDDGPGVDFGLEGVTDQERAAPLATYLRAAQQRPVAFMEQRVKALWDLWGPWPDAGDPHRPRNWLTRAAIGLRFPAVVLALLIVCLQPRWSAGWLLAIPIITITAVHTLFFSTPRFTFPAEPFILILIGAGAAAFARRHPRSASLAAMGGSAGSSSTG